MSSSFQIQSISWKVRFGKINEGWCYFFLKFLEKCVGSGAFFVSWKVRSGKINEDWCYFFLKCLEKYVGSGAFFVSILIFRVHVHVCFIFDTDLLAIKAEDLET